MTYELKVYRYNDNTNNMELVNTIRNEDNDTAIKKLAEIFMDKYVKNIKTKITHANNELKITQTWLGATNFDTKIPSDYKITSKYEYIFRNCNL